MPTTRPRHVVTESDELARALDAAASRWPDVSRGQLVVRLALEGDQRQREIRAQVGKRRREAVTAAGEILSGTGARAELERMRAEEWPA